MNQQDRIKQLIDLREKAKLGGGGERVAAQHEKGKQTKTPRLVRSEVPGPGKLRIDKKEGY